MFHFHKWKLIKKPYETSIEQQKYIRYYTKYRKCMKCGKIEIDDFYGFCELDAEATKIIDKMLIDKGDYFELDVPLKKKQMKPPKEE